MNVKDENKSKYKFNLVYEKKIARLIAKNRLMKNLFDFVLYLYFHNHLSRFTIELNNDIEREQIRMKFDL